MIPVFQTKNKNKLFIAARASREGYGIVKNMHLSDAFVWTS